MNILHEICFFLVYLRDNNIMVVFFVTHDTYSYLVTLWKAVKQKRKQVKITTNLLILQHIFLSPWDTINLFVLVKLR